MNLFAYITELRGIADLCSLIRGHVGSCPDCDKNRRAADRLSYMASVPAK